MEKFFNTAGPIKPELHYRIPSFERLDWDEVQRLIASQKYFLLHAPRQTGKTSALLEMMEALNQGDNYHAVYANIEGAQAARNNITNGIAVVCRSIAESAQIYLNEARLENWVDEKMAQIEGEGRLRALLRYWAKISDKPIVLFLDEVDALVGDTLISLLRQIRSGYAQRPEMFPQSIVLCGVRDIKDYRIHQGNGEIITGGSAFNIKSKSLRIGNFTRDEVHALWQQHTDASGQTFAEQIFPELWEDTAGQPWLVNALGYELTWEERSLRDRNVPITLEHYYAAREQLIRSRATHLDQLADKLKEERVHRVISSILAAGETTFLNIPPDDQSYVEDLGLIVSRPQLRIANRIYREIIPRELTWVVQSRITQQSHWFITDDQRLDMPKLLTAFQQFFREHSKSWIEQFQYKEAGPQLLMQAFLQRIINGGGRINREYALGRKRTDLAIEWPLDEEQGFFGPVQRIIIELKIRYGALDGVIAKGIEQTSGYADSFGAQEAYLIIFNRDAETPWEEKIWQRNENCGTRKIGVWGM
ncbi:MAG: AAA-like domain-containing protein [Thermodesulfobacteriota bacterium]|nr:AAA-like domain-containing protein [Thermodesulfobacteriota bacterium]MEA3465893.1 AAA-like domain-containing protein [Thermodesulfobacteriota bacterium]